MSRLDWSIDTSRVKIWQSGFVPFSSGRTLGVDDLLLIFFFFALICFPRIFKKQNSEECGG